MSGNTSAPAQLSDGVSRIEAQAAMQGARTFGCEGERHVPRPYVGDPPFPRFFRCYCGAKGWRIEACPTCGHDRPVTA